MPELGTFFRHCPSCGRRFEIKVMEEAELSDDKGYSKTKEILTPQELTLRVGSGGPRVTMLKAKTTFARNLNTIWWTKESRVTFQCKHCGHEWTEEKFEPKRAVASRDYTSD